MKWPRGKYNGERIVGFEFKFQMDVTDWAWIPRSPKYSHCLNWLCFRIWVQAHYDTWEKVRQANEQRGAKSHST
jgi:hypothetical protein